MHYAFLRPRELTRLRKKCPVAYLPLGILEWHGFHNPVGLDGIKSERTLSHLAAKFGGLVFPTQYWGDNRADVVDVICDSGVSGFPPPDMGDHVTPICNAMGLSRARLEKEAERSKRNGGWQLWEALLTHSLFQIESLGFELIILYPGHYPMHHPLQRAVDAYVKQGGISKTFILADHLVGQGDHAAAIETSLLMALCPELVELSELQPGTRYHLGVVGEDPLQSASAEKGRTIIEQFETIVKEQMALYLH